MSLIIAGCDKWSDARIAESKRRGDIVCGAIQAYRQKTGKYPVKLADLRPEFLADVPQPAAGPKDWDYYVVDGATDFTLSVLEHQGSPILYRMATRDWEILNSDRQ